MFRKVTSTNVRSYHAVKVCRKKQLQNTPFRIKRKSIQALKTLIPTRINEPANSSITQSNRVARETIPVTSLLLFSLSMPPWRRRSDRKSKILTGRRLCFWSVGLPYTLVLRRSKGSWVYLGYSTFTCFCQSFLITCHLHRTVPSGWNLTTARSE